MKFPPKYQTYLKRLGEKRFVTLNDLMEVKKILVETEDEIVKKMISMIPDTMIQEGKRNQKLISKIISTLSEEDLNHTNPMPRLRSHHRVEQLATVTGIPQSNIRFCLKLLEQGLKSLNKLVFREDLQM